MQTNKYLGSILLIAGTSIGAGMLALPVSTAAYGFLPSIGLFVLCWLCMLLTGLILLEVNLWLKPGTNIVSMATQTLGIWGKLIALIAYFLLFYSLMAAYVSGMGDLVQKTVADVFHKNIYNGSGALLLILIVGTVIYIGTRPVDYLNRLFFMGKMLTYIFVIIFLAPHMQLPNLERTSTSHMWLALPVVITSFGFQNVLPSLRVYLNDDVKKLRRAILIGSTIPLIVYILWELIILGVVPLNGNEGLLQVFVSGQPATGLAHSLDHILQKGWISILFKVFTFCAIATSFIGVSFSLFDFLIDTFKIKRTSKGKMLTLVIAFLPSLLFAYYYPNGFILALGYAGIFVAILFGILPVLMLWSGRDWKKIATGYRVNIGKTVQILIIIFSIIIMLTQLAAR
ncbi:MAG TPA: aromatic amino acid transport family protein [Gammaproteobacteria bacterium]|nr:aromatic amino acid transport family protein [Gammaproteobacteria bacterium]